MNIAFFKKIYNDDIIYHYTKASTAIDHILFDNQLRFGKAPMSNDPIESHPASRGTVYFQNDYEKHINQHGDVTDELHDFTCDLEKSFQQVSFCRNTMGEDFSSKMFHTQFDGNQELFGFAKPRMWDQYAEKYAGVCLAFSKKKILSLNKSELELLEDNINYHTFQELSIKKAGDIQGDYLSKVGIDLYKQQLEQQVKKSFFYKHKDYSGENEYRIGTLYDKDKYSIEKVKGECIISDNMMLNIENCLEAIFVSSYANDRQKNDLLEYANSLEIPIVEMYWKYNTFECLDYREEQRLMSEIAGISSETKV